MEREEIQRLAKKYHMLPNSLKVQVYYLFEQGLWPAEIVDRNLLPGLKKITIFTYFSEWKRRHSLNDFETEERARLVE